MTLNIINALIYSFMAMSITLGGALFLSFIQYGRRVRFWMNEAMAIRSFGLFFGMAIAMGLFMSDGSSSTSLSDLLISAKEAIIMATMVLVASVVCDKAVLPKVSNTKAVRDHNNTAVAYVEAAMFMATGIIAGGSFKGDGEDSILVAIVFFAIGQLVLVASAHVYERIIGVDIEHMVSLNKGTAGILLGSIILSQGIIIFGAVSGAFTSWQSDILYVVVFALLGFGILKVYDIVFDHILLGRRNKIAALGDAENNGSLSTIIIAACTRVSAAIVIACVI